MKLNFQDECDRTKPDHKGNEIKLKSGRIDETKLPKMYAGQGD